MPIFIYDTKLRSLILSLKSRAAQLVILAWKFRDRNSLSTKSMTFSWIKKIIIYLHYRS